MKERILSLAEGLRTAGVRASVGELLDALEAVATAGVERESLREALAATLVKDHAHRERFDALFDATFPLRRAGSRGERGEDSRGERGEDSRGERGEDSRGERGEDSRGERGEDSRGERGEVSRGERGERGEVSRAPERGSESEPLLEPGQRAARRLARQRELLARRWRDLDRAEIGEARVLAEALARRFERRWSRRLQRARRGRIDPRATLRHAMAHGGVPVELRRRRRRPTRPDLLALVDLSWSTATAAELLLSLLAPARHHFREVTILGYVGDVAEISLEHGHVVPHAPLDLDARSDLGRVLARVAEREVGRRDVVLILGDARNNRLAPRADALASLARRARAVAWLNPEAPERWGTGDSDILRYAPHVDVLLAAPDLASLARGLDRVARRAAVPRARRSPGSRREV